MTARGMSTAQYWCVSFPQIIQPTTIKLNYFLFIQDIHNLARARAAIIGTIFLHFDSAMKMRRYYRAFAIVGHPLLL